MKDIREKAQTQIAAELAPLLNKCDIVSMIPGAKKVPLPEGCYTLIAGEMADVVTIGSRLGQLAKTGEW